MQIDPYLNHSEIRKKFKQKKIIANFLRFLFIILVLIAMALEYLDTNFFLGYSTLHLLIALTSISGVSILILILNGKCPACKKGLFLFFDNNICHKCKFDFSKSNQEVVHRIENNDITTIAFKSLKKRQDNLNIFLIIIAMFGGGLLIFKTPLFFGIQSTLILTICAILFIISIIYSMINWRCPACKSSLGNSLKITKCPSCKIDFKLG